MKILEFTHCQQLKSEEYAADHGWIKVNATNNIRRLRKQYDSKEGPFSAKEVNKTEPFKTRKTKSKAYTLLLKCCGRPLTCNHLKLHL
mmetsp:Transcript_2529/g.5583  ORF Transcript_2529/g.5583 Transcript_2529/m.5583 type:complete len:88 (-) Transcript_2529:322-585(-)